MSADGAASLSSGSTAPIECTPVGDERPGLTAALRRGDAVGRYVALERVGAGTFGEVFAAYDPELDRKVALKLLRATKAIAGWDERMLREARALARLSHPNVVPVYDVGAWRGRMFIAMEFVEGVTLNHHYNTIHTHK